MGAADVVIVGGGLAGLTAAARASELGCSVIVLEAGGGAHYPCNTRYSGGVFHLAFTDLAAPPDVLRAAIDATLRGTGDARWADLLAQNAGRFVDWLREGGTVFQKTAVAWQSHILSPSRAIVAGQDWQGRGPDVLLNRLGEAIRARGGRILDATRGRRLLMDGTRCIGIEATSRGKAIRLDARNVVLADGGFQANLERLGCHIAPAPAAVKQRGGASGLGDGLAMALEAGAAISELDRFYGHLLCRDAMTNDRVWPYPELDALALAGVVVDASGRRITDEGVGGVALANAIAAMDDPLCATVVFDARIWDGPGASARIAANPALADAGGTIHRADTLAALAAKAGIDPAALGRTVAAHNAALAGASMAQLTPPRTTDRHQPMPIATAPFMAIPLCAGITYTMGGIRVDDACRMERAAGGVFEGLYAAGSTTGGFEGGPHVAYVGGLTRAGVQGLLAAEHIAAASRGGT
ncbi:MAG: FAD-dependent oxidoreductase [Hyphomicrobiaceae bacterium]